MAKQRLIDAIRFSRIIKEYRNEFPQRTARQKVCNDFLAMLGDETQTPTADAVEVRHGEWKKQQFIGRSGFFSVKDFTCSNCFENFAVEQGKGLMNYCPNCGAKMDGSGADDARST